MSMATIGIWLAGVAAACSGAVASGGDAASAPAFERVDVHVGVTTSSLLATHVDGDGKLDLLVVGGERVTTLRGRGDGRFDVGAAVPAGEQAVDLALADLDGDGRRDLAVANHETDHVTLLFGTPGGGFEARAASRFVVDVAPHPHAVRTADIDGDGRADLLVDHRHAEAVRAYRGTEGGGLERALTIPVGGDPYRGFELVDLDGDGALDLLTPNPDHVAVLRGDGRGGFTPHATLRPDFAPFSVAAADLDGDGRTDVAAASGEGAGALAVWLATPDGGFRAGDTFALATGPTRLAAADLTGDGAAELIVSSYLGDEVAVLGGGSEPTLQRMSAPGRPYGIATGDLDGDGRTDFAVAHDRAEHITVFLSSR